VALMLPPVLTRVLVVDDSRSLRRMIRTALAIDGHDIVESETADKALGLIRIAPPDLVIVDINMPGMDGLTFVRVLRDLPPFRFTPVLIVTTERGAEMKQRGFAAGATGWIVKPFDPEQLRRLVGQLLCKRAKAG
jgi:two-component system chemotaxis response regulator CheY